MQQCNARDAVLVACGRSPLTRANKGGLAGTHPVEYGAQTLRGVLARLPGLDPARIDDIVVGCATPEKNTGYNVALLIAQRAGLPDEVPAQTVNRFCSSGLQSLETAANAIRSGAMDIVVAGGIEQMTGMAMGLPKEYWDAALTERCPDAYLSMGMTAENVARQFHIARADMDAMAVESHRRAAAAQAAGYFDEEIIPITVRNGAEETVLSRDDGIRPNTTMETLAGLKPCFLEGGSVTAATSSQMTDGAAFAVLMARETAEKLGCTPIAAFRAFAVRGVPAGIMGIGPIAAVPLVMAKLGLTIADMDVIELNEAFAAQALACIRELKLPMDKVNPNGGAMALGHPMGATGTVLTCKALSQLRRIKGRYALVTMCIGGGMGAAGIWELERA